VEDAGRAFFSLKIEYAWATSSSGGRWLTTTEGSSFTACTSSSLSQQRHTRVMQRDRRFRFTHGAPVYLPWSQCQVRTRQGKSSVVSGAQVVNKDFAVLLEGNKKGVRRTGASSSAGRASASRASGAPSP